jgi:hypothetical protein
MHLVKSLACTLNLQCNSVESKNTKIFVQNRQRIKLWLKEIHYGSRAIKTNKGWILQKRRFKFFVGLRKRECKKSAAKIKQIRVSEFLEFLLHFKFWSCTSLGSFFKITYHLTQYYEEILKLRKLVFWNKILLHKGTIFSEPIQARKVRFQEILITWRYLP